MTTPVRLLCALAERQFLPPDQLVEAERLLDRSPDPAALADALVRRGLLSSFQAQWVARGRVPAVGPYHLLALLGRGTMGRVFLARHHILERRVALKVARAPRGHVDRVRGRFRREARALGRLDHPNVAYAFDAGVECGVYYLAMEYVPGPDLAYLARERGPLPAAEACGYARQAALGLHHLHEQGVVHRDVKPENLSLADGGRVVKVLDVGLARVPTGSDPVPGLTQAGQVVGSVDYTAPEQIQNPQVAGPAADQYGLGCTLYHLLAGQPPFRRGAVVATVLAHLTEPLAAIAGVSSDVASVVGRMTAKRPGDRYPSLSDAADALASAASAAPTGVFPAPNAETRF